MTSVIEVPVLECSSCGRELAEEQVSLPATLIYGPVGKCCHNLPVPWLYNHETHQYDADGSSEDEDEDEDREDCRPTCGNCGGMRFTITATEWHKEQGTIRVDGHNDDLDDSRLYYDPSDLSVDETIEHDEFTVVRVECHGCGHDCSDDFPVESY